MELQLSHFKSWKMILWKFCTQYARKFGKLRSVSFLSSPKERHCQRMFKLLQNWTHLTNKVMLKIVQAKFQQCVIHELPDVQAGFRRGRGIRDQIANICWIVKKARVPENHRLMLYWLCQSLQLCGSQQIVGNSSIGENTRPPDLLPEKSVGRQETTVSTGHWAT